MRKHPIVEFVRYLILLTIAITTMNPVVIGVLLIVSTIITRFRLWLIDLWLFVAIVVIDLFSSLDGVTFIAYHNYHIITFEALVYGLISGLRLVTVVQLSWKFSQDVRSDKLVVVTSFLAPPLSLLLSMSVRNVRRYSVKIKEIYWTQLSLEENQGLVVKIVVGVRSMSILIDWALDNGMETITSMESRGYGKHRRTCYRPISITSLDLVELFVYLLVTIAYYITVPSVVILPEINIGFSLLNTITIVVVGMYCLLEEYFESKSKQGCV